ncbi:glycosyltransferase family 4 protein [Ningiella sp. W23]|uniref:glycosyltransferase family 4 protein n=1 Tax=Ningiella sp. W23 TaxID=3023715 RepID=UPI003757D5EC
MKLSNKSKSNIRVLHLIKTSIGAGWALRQTRELIALGIEVHIVLPEGPMVKKYEQAGVVTHVFDPSFSVTSIFSNRARSAMLRNLVEHIQPDIIHSHFVATTLLMRWSLRKLDIPRIFHVPGPLHLEHLIFRQLDLLSAKYLSAATAQDYWLASCKWTKNAYRSYGVNKARVGLAYYGVNEGDFTAPEPTTLSLRKELNIDDESFLIGMIAYFYAPKPYLGQRRGLKGHEDLIDAMAIVCRTYPKTKCVFVGGPWAFAQRYFEKVKAYAQKVAPEACVFLGVRTDVPTIYPQLNLAVHPSHSENVGGAVESMYAKTPTLASNVGGFPDLICDNETGLLAPAKNPEALAEKIIYAIENQDKLRDFATKGFVKVKEVMNVEHNAKEVLDFYQHVLCDYRNKSI